MDSFIYKASTMRGETQLALTEIEIKRRINETIKNAAIAGEYWCHFVMPTLLEEKVVDDIVSALLACGYRVKVMFNKTYCLTILWAPEDMKVTFDGEDWS